MKFFSVSLALVTAATAIDIRFSADCYGGWAQQCANINPNTCCNSNTHWNAVILAAIPSGWSVTLDQYVFASCKSLFSSWNPSSDNQCNYNGRGLAVSAGYHFRGKKMARGQAGEETAAAGKECQKVDSFVSPDGTTYPIDHLSDSEVQYLVRVLLPATCHLLTFLLGSATRQWNYGSRY